MGVCPDSGLVAVHLCDVLSFGLAHHHFKQTNKRFQEFTHENPALVVACWEDNSIVLGIVTTQLPRDPLTNVRDILNPGKIAILLMCKHEMSTRLQLFYWHSLTMFWPVTGTNLYGKHLERSHRPFSVQGFGLHTSEFPASMSR